MLEMCGVGVGRALVLLGLGPGFAGADLADPGGVRGVWNAHMRGFLPANERQAHARPDSRDTPPAAVAREG